MGTWTTIAPSNHSAYLATPQTGAGPGVLVLHAWWGLNPDIAGFCDRLAAQGFVALAPSLYADGRTASSISEAESLIEEHDSDPSLAAGVAIAALTMLHALPEVNSEQLGVIGFSMGAYWALWIADSRPDEIGAAVAVYGSNDSEFANSTADFLLHFAEDDEYEPLRQQQGLEQALLDAGRDVTVHVYPGTHHWFVEPGRTDVYDQTAADLMWERTIGFFRSRLM